MTLSIVDYGYAGLFLSGMFMTVLTTLACRKLAVKLDIMDRPKIEAHKGHAKATPLLGGLAIFWGWGLVLAGVMIFLKVLSSGFLTIDFGINTAGFFRVYDKFYWVFAGALLAVILGLIDDVKGMKAGSKFFGQLVVAAIAVILGGVRISLFVNSEVLTVLISIFWFMLLMNSINFFDNMDGLAVGTITIALGLFAIIAGLNGQYLVAGFSFLSCGATMGFWFFNHTPASIFMGDSGSHLLGYLAAVISSSVTYFNFSDSLSKFPILVPLFVLAVPLFDTAMVVIIRTLNHKPFWIGDHNHISHRFVKMGLSRKNAVMLVHMTALAVGLGAFPVMWGDFKVASIVVLQMIFLLAILSILQFLLKDEK